ncbi:MAG: hypothetical protein KatS3mg130_0032 [Candidatus Sumerlaea sp.]|nr:MAG: hypothetical protein KatS3mg130_0032 [Candidatus Sumerlaea sp.]
MKICLPTQSVSSLTTFILVCVFAVLGVPATPQPACKRAEMISRASDELRQRVREAVEKRRAIESELAEIEKQMQEVEGRRRERERELLRDYDQEIQKWEGATKELTEMINLLSVAGWNSFMRRFGHMFVHPPKPKEHWIEQQRVARTRLANVAREKIPRLKRSIKATKQKITNIENQLSGLEQSLAETRDRLKALGPQPPTPGEQKDWATRRNALSRKAKNLEGKLKNHRTELNPLLTKHKDTLKQLEADCALWEQLDAKNQKALHHLNVLAHESSSDSVVEYIGQYGELKDLQKDASDPELVKKAAELSQAQLEQILREEERRRADASAAEFIMGGDPYVMLSGDANSILAELDPLAKVDILIRRREIFQQILSDTKRLREQRYRELADEWEPFNKEIAALRDQQQKLQKARDAAQHAWLRSYAGLQAVDSRLYEAMRECEKQRAKEKPRIVSTKGSRHRKSAIAQITTTGLAIRGGGSFPEKGVDQPCEPPIVVGEVRVPSGGKFRAHILGTPPVPPKWSLYNTNSSLIVQFLPELGYGLGEPETLLSLSGQTKDNDLRGEASWYGAGVLRAIAGAPRGSGPLTGQCFGQSFTAEVNVVELFAFEPALAGETLEVGDEIQTERDGQVLLQTPGGATATIGSETRAVIQSESPENLTLTLLSSKGDKGGIRVKEPEPSTQRIAVWCGNHLVRPFETDYVVSGDGQTTHIAVLAGKVEVTTGTQSPAATVTQGQQLTLPQWKFSSIDPKLATKWQISGLEPDEVALNDTPTTYSTLSFSGEDLLHTWTFQDPDNDCSTTIADEQTILVEVPDGNEFWGHRTSSPRLLRKITGDFVLEATVDLVTAAKHFAILDFVVYSPASYTGHLASQMARDGIGAHYQLLTSLLQVWEGTKRAPVAEPPEKWQSLETTQPLMIRVARHGNVWRYNWSLDGHTWWLGAEKQLSLPETLWIGFLWKRVASDGLRETPAFGFLSEVRLQTAPLYELFPDGWDCIAYDGSASFTPTSVTLTLAGDRLGAVRIRRPEPLLGDFDVVVRYTLRNWQHEAGQSRSASVFASDLTDQNMGYVALEERDGLQRSVSTDLRDRGRWAGRHAHKIERDNSWLRLRRENSRFSAWHWEQCEWVPVAKAFDGVLTGPVTLQFLISNKTAARVPAPLEADFEIVSVGDPREEDVATPRSLVCDFLTEIDLPSSVSILAAGKSRYWRAAAPLGRMFFGPDGSAFLFSAPERGDGFLMKLSPTGVTKHLLTTDTLAGRNLKAGLFHPDAGVWFTVDLCYECGNRHGGLFWWQPGGPCVRVPLEPALGGLTDLVPCPEGGVWVSDFEQDGIWYLANPESPKLEPVQMNPRLPGILQLAYEPRRRVFYALNTSEAPGGGIAGVYELPRAGGTPLLLAKQGPNQRWAALAYGGTGAFGDALYVADNALGVVWQIRLRDKTMTPLIMGLNAPTALGISPTTHELYVVCGAGREVLAFKPTQPLANEELSPEEGRQGPTTQVSPPKQGLPPSSGASAAPPAVTSPPRPTSVTSSKADAPPTRSIQDQGKPVSTFRLSQKTDSWLLLAESPRNRFIADLEVTCLKPGTILDTIGINAAPRGSFSLAVGPDGRVYFQIYDPKAQSSVKIANGWHVVTSTRKLQWGTPARIVAMFDRGTCSLYLDGKLEKLVEVPTALSGKPVYLGDYPGDENWGPRYNIHQAMIGTVRIHQTSEIGASPRLE